MFPISSSSKVIKNMIRDQGKIDYNRDKEIKLARESQGLRISPSPCQGLYFPKTSSLSPSLPLNYSLEDI
jgi:hypothetical protein